MYITSDLFGLAADSTSASPANLCHAPSFNKVTVDPGLGKRKRGKEEPTQAEYGQPPSPAKMFRMQTFPQSTAPGHRAWRIGAGTAAITQTRPLKQMKRAPSKRPPPMLTKSASHLMDTDEPISLRLCPASSEPPSAACDLRSCHICHSAPKRRSDLENFLECRSCEGRACYICARECAGGCQRQLCRKCCVEAGEEGTTWCLDCYQRIEMNC